MTTEQEVQDSQKVEKKLKRSEKSVKNYQFFILRLLVLLAVIWVLFFKIIGLTHMPNEDMYPRVDAGDLVLFYRLNQDVRAQDVVVIEKVTPDSGGEKSLFISRVVAVEGDTVEISNNRLIVNGNVIMEHNIFYETPVYEGYTQFPMVLGKDECFVLADARQNGTDSRYFGAVQKNEIVGTVITIVRRNNL